MSQVNRTIIVSDVCKNPSNTAVSDTRTIITHTAMSLFVLRMIHCPRNICLPQVLCAQKPDLRGKWTS